MIRARGRTPLLDELVDEVLRGERIVLFAPGIVAFVAANMGLLFGSVLLCVIVLPTVWDGGALSYQGWAPLVGIGIALISLCVSAFLVAQGHSAGYAIFQRITGTWLALAGLALAAAIAKFLSASPLVVAIPSLLLAGTFFASKSAAYATFVQFKKLLRIRRRELLLKGKPPLTTDSERSGRQAADE